MQSNIYKYLRFCSFKDGGSYWLAGEYGKARQTLEDCQQFALEWKFFDGWAQRILGEIACKTDPSEADSHFEKTISICRQIKTENELALAYAGYGRFYKQQGNIEQAKRYLNKASKIFE